ncbi:MAG: winged helix-turn-helix domain-containing protein [Betaproteobacteria bacterium]|jgi:DNA-binding winged helix-turn-helix (wHTH) protein/TolB-like protein|nr:winged helix-turn-helix domain-containing protein [Betaproteobacteria bacterium]
MQVGIESSPTTDKERLQVGDWTVEPPLNQLSAAGKTVKLEPKAMSVLVFLADRPGQVVSRDVLLSAVWPGAFVGDDSLTQVIIKLRKALGDAPENPAYIQTIPKGGYRLVAPVGRSEESAAEPVPPDSATLHSNRARRISWIAGAGAAALLLAAAGIWWVKSERVVDVPPGPRSIAGAVADRTAQPTVAISPFEALGDDPQVELLAQGIKADLVTDLSKVTGLAVIDIAPMGSGKPPADAPKIRYHVSGSLQRVDERVRLQIRLTDAQTGKQLWSERFDRAIDSFFAIQEELGPKLLQVLPAKVSEAELRRVAQRYTRNLEAYELFQRGQSALLVRQRAENETARELFRRAIALDAAFARAYAALALTYAAEYRNQWTGDGAAALTRAFELAQTALQIDPDIPETYWVLAFVNLERRQHEQALQYLETALRLYPSFADGYALMGGVNTYIGRPAETVRLVRAAMRLNPQGNYLYFLVLGRAYLFLGDLEQARVNLDEALLRNPVNLEAHVYMAALYVTAGDKSAAAWEAEEIRSLQPGFSSRGWLATDPMTDVAQKTKLVQALGELGF